MNKIYLLIFIFLNSNIAFSGTIKIKGVVRDANTKGLIKGEAIIFCEDSPEIIAIPDNDGRFNLEFTPPPRKEQILLICEAKGYNKWKKFVLTRTYEDMICDLMPEEAQIDFTLFVYDSITHFRKEGIVYFDNINGFDAKLIDGKCNLKFPLNEIVKRNNNIECTINVDEYLLTPCQFVFSEDEKNKRLKYSKVSLRQCNPSISESNYKESEFKEINKMFDLINKYQTNQNPDRIEESFNDLFYEINTIQESKLNSISPLSYKIAQGLFWLDIKHNKEKALEFFKQAHSLYCNNKIFSQDIRLIEKKIKIIDLNEWLQQQIKLCKN